jgi:hypothetical protein
MLLVGAGVAYARGRLGPAAVLLLVAAGPGLLGLCAPRALGFAYGPWMRVARGLGWLNTQLLLGLTFYLVVTPVGLLMRLLGKDPLGKRRGGASYWRRPQASSLGDKHFERPF